MMEQQTLQSREIWIDGLRGFAALIVAWFHMTAGYLATPYRSFWDEPAADNRHLLQIAPFRIVFAGQAMVCIFFVVSGYSISVSLVKRRNEQDFLSGFYHRLASSVVRRIFRLFIPVLIMMLISHTLYYIGLYSRPFSENTGCPGAVPWSSPIPHIRCFVRSFSSIINLQRNQDLTLNDHLWTIPVEMHGSLMVYLALFGLSTVRDTTRLLVIALLCIRSCWNGKPEIMAFFLGLMLAEVNGLSTRRKRELHLRAFNTALVHYSALAVGVYLICLPVRIRTDGSTDSEFSEDWFFLKVIPPLPWWNFETTVRTWHTLGAVLVVGSMGAMTHVQALFQTRLGQFLGHISFGLYLCHQTVYRVMLQWLLRWFSMRVAGVSYSDARSQGLWGTVYVAWAFSTPLIWMVLLPASKYMARSVDQKSIVLAGHIERRIS